MKIATMGMGLVKAVFAIHGVKAHGKAAVKNYANAFKGARLSPAISLASSPWRPVAVPTYGARKPAAPGHTVRLMAPQLVKPCVKDPQERCRRCRRCRRGPGHGLASQRDAAREDQTADSREEHLLNPPTAKTGACTANLVTSAQAGPVANESNGSNRRIPACRSAPCTDPGPCFRSIRTRPGSGHGYNRTLEDPRPNDACGGQYPRSGCSSRPQDRRSLPMEAMRPPRSWRQRPVEPEAPSCRVASRHNLVQGLTGRHGSPHLSRC